MERMTELEAINRMLLGVQLAPAASIDDIDVYSEGMLARSILKQVTMDVISTGWHFNTRRMTLTPDINQIIHLPARTVDVFTPQTEPTEYMQDTNGNLVDLSSGTNLFTTPATVYVVQGYDFQDLPPVFQSLVLHKSRLAFKTEMSTEMTGDSSLIMKDINDAEVRAKMWDTRSKRLSMLDGLKSRVSVSQNYPRWL